jgi:3-oxoacyl-[acyl-carrier protein] reductase
MGNGFIVRFRKLRIKMNLKNKNVIITGGTRGIGKAITESLIDEGANVIILARTRSDLKKINQELQNKGNIIGIKCDVTSPSDIKKMINQVKLIFKKIDVLINNVGTAYIGPVDKMSLSDWNYVINTNLTSVFLCCKEIIPIMKKYHDGCIINVVSNSAKNGAANFSAYCASKFGELGFSQSLFSELLPYKIRVIAVCPGGVDTDLWKNVKNDPKIKPNVEKALKPKNVADVINFILKHDEILFKEPVFLPSSLYY